jgi:aminoglycoside 6'-N-acetyltransferase I
MLIDGVKIRTVCEADKAEWRRLRTALWPDGSEDHAAEIKAFLGSDPFPWSKSFLALAVFVATRPTGGLCGFVEASIRPHVDGCDTKPVGYVEGWFVDPDVRRQGIGRCLVEAAERWSMNRGCKEMASDAHLGNKISLQAHKALGFEESSRNVYFRKRLTESSDDSMYGDLSARPLRLLIVEGAFAISKLPTGSPLPQWATQGVLFSITRTAEELSIVCGENQVPEGINCERDWRCLRVAGAMAFTVVGVLASLTAPLAPAGISLFAISTFDTDYVLVKAADFERAITVLRSAGHDINHADGVGRFRGNQP